MRVPDPWLRLRGGVLCPTDTCLVLLKPDGVGRGHFVNSGTKSRLLNSPVPSPKHLYLGAKCGLDIFRM